jgi:hypothetical protein
MGAFAIDSSASLESTVEVNSPHRHRPNRDSRHPLLDIWVVSTGILFCLCAAWSLATPIGAANDEPAQLVKAASVVRGELVGPIPSTKLVTHLPAWDKVGLQYCLTRSSANLCNRAVTVVTVPESFANYTSPGCYILNPKVPAGCGYGLRGSGKETTVTTYVGRYPPLYYAIIGLPSLVWHSDMAVYLMRLLSGLLGSLFLGLAFALATVWSRSRLLGLALAVTATPTVIMFASVVNPSGLEMATAICVWTGGLILVLDWANHPPPSLIAATAVAAIVMVLMRGLSPLWLVIIAACLAVLAPRSLPELIRWHSVRIAVGAITCAGVVAVAYIFEAHALYVYPVGLPIRAGTSQFGTVQIALGRTGTLVGEFVGTFGWTETSAPLAVMGLWLFSASAIAVLGIIASLRRHAAVIVVLIVASLVLPTGLMVSQAHKDGLVWQARDGFPLYAGILLVAGATAGRNGMLNLADTGVAPMTRWAGRRLTLLLAIALGAVQLGDFLWALRRYTVGLGSVINPFSHVPGGWNPPGTSLGLAAIATVGTVAYCWWIARLGRLSRSTMLGGREGMPASAAA